MRSNLTLPLISKRKIIRFPIAIFAAGIIPSQTAVMPVSYTHLTLPTTAIV